MNGVLYIVATPIGNIDDISRRAIEVLSSVAMIAAEDTRHSKPLLNRLGIQTRTFAFHDHNENSRIDWVIEKLNAGEDIALISDAGTPLISDPGYGLVKAVQQAQLKVVAIPGASSVITALSGAGLPTDNFYFYGFLSHKNSERISQLEALKKMQTTLILFESSHRILRLMEQLSLEYSEQVIVIAKELTKLHERFMRGTPVQLFDILNEDQKLQKGEFVVLIDNRRREINTDDLDYQERMLRVLLTELPVKKAVKIVVELTGAKKNAIYQKALDLRCEREA